MSIIKMENKTNHMFERALHCCVKAFGCICTPKGDTLYITCFQEGDDLVISDTLESTGSKLLGYSTINEYMEVFA